jgi:hypothetical protein
MASLAQKFRNASKGASCLGGFLLFGVVCLLIKASVWRRSNPILHNIHYSIHNSLNVSTYQEVSSTEDASHGGATTETRKDGSASGTMRDILYGLRVLQDQYFEPWIGTWPSANDWTAAVVGTQISGALNAITRHHTYTDHDAAYGTVSGNTVSGYFTHLTSFYFGENAFSLRTQAYDDMQWVILDWLEGIKIAKLHSDLHFSGGKDRNSSWHGKDYIAAFAHRARVFWGLASKGWETTLCGGGMLWSPYGIPYKNAITNELYIASSVSMYLYFPGDDNSFPFSEDVKVEQHSQSSTYTREHDRKYLDAAIAAYSWLESSSMKNKQGLYTDGFHIAGWKGGRNGSNGTGNCDVRDEKVYTYNQGVVLTGQRGLWEATGSRDYLEDGHRLIRNVIAATGYHLADTVDRHRWAGLGRNGIMEETCDATSSCSQNGQTFKSIFFHHLSTFCEPLPVGRSGPIFYKADKLLAKMHRQSCSEYGPWIARNVKAALGTRDSEGRFGTWWTIGLDDFEEDDAPWKYDVAQAGTDYRNEGLPKDDLWRMPGDTSVLPGTGVTWTLPATDLRNPNDRGRGRTVETQCGGLALLGALYKIVELQQAQNVTTDEL